MKTFSAAQHFACFRMLFGFYLAWHFAALFPYAAELFSNTGVLPDPRLNFTYGLFPNPLAVWNESWMVTTFVGAGFVLALLFMTGWQRPGVSVLLWFLWACLFHRNNLISNPSVPYIGLLLLLSALVPRGESWSWDRKQSTSWVLPPMIYRTAWFLMAAGYSFSGWYKVGSPSWIDGSALIHVLENPLARPNFFRAFILDLPPVLLHLMTWSVLALELSFLPLSLWRKGRALIWFTMVLMHLGIMFLIDFADLSLGMLMLHAFTFDPAWLPENFCLPKLSFQNNLKIQKI